MGDGTRIQTGMSGALAWANGAEGERAEPSTKAPASTGEQPAETGPTPVVRLGESGSAALFRRNDPRATGAHGAPSTERPVVAPGVKSENEVIACKVAFAALGSAVGGMATPALLGTAAVWVEGAASGVGTGVGLTDCDNAPPTPSRSEGAGGAPGA